MNGIYNYEERLQQYKRIMDSFGDNGEVVLRFLNHLFSLNLIASLTNSSFEDGGYSPSRRLAAISSKIIYP